MPFSYVYRSLKTGKLSAKTPILVENTGKLLHESFQRPFISAGQVSNLRKFIHGNAMKFIDKLCSQFLKSFDVSIGISIIKNSAYVELGFLPIISASLVQNHINAVHGDKILKNIINIIF